MVVAKANAIGPGWRVLLSGDGRAKDIGTRNHGFIFNIIDKAADVESPIPGHPGQSNRTLRVGVLQAMQVALVRGAIIVRIIKLQQRRQRTSTT